MNSQLDQIRALIEANELSRARDELRKFLEDNPENAQGWFLASFVQPTPEMRLTSIKRATKLQPDQQEIQKRLAKLESALEKKKRPTPLPALALGLFVLAIMLVSAIALLNRNTLPTPNELPTLAVLRAVTDMPTQPTPTLVRSGSQVPVPTANLPVLQPQTTSVNLDVTAIGSPVEPVVQTAVVSLVASTPVFITPQPNNPLSLPTASADVTLDAFTAPSSTATSTPISIIPTQPTVAGSTSIPTVVPVVPLTSVITISAGEFRVVDSTRGAESMIQSLGGTFPPAPANQSWFLLELLLDCKNRPTCAFDPSTLKIKGASGAIFAYSPELNLIPMFGAITQNNQIWGYLGYIIPKNETALELTLSENGQIYNMALK